MWRVSFLNKLSFLPQDETGDYLLPVARIRLILQICLFPVILFLFAQVINFLQHHILQGKQPTR